MSPLVWLKLSSRDSSTVSLLRGGRSYAFAMSGGFSSTNRWSSKQLTYNYFMTWKLSTMSTGVHAQKRIEKVAGMLLPPSHGKYQTLSAGSRRYAGATTCLISPNTWSGQAPGSISWTTSGPITRAFVMRAQPNGKSVVRISTPTATPCTEGQKSGSYRTDA